jgi:hypothetical protein
MCWWDAACLYDSVGCGRTQQGVGWQVKVGGKDGRLVAMPMQGTWPLEDKTQACM